MGNANNPWPYLPCFPWLHPLTAEDELIEFWWTPKKRGSGQQDFVYSYKVPTPPDEKDNPYAQKIYIQSEGKLKFNQYKQLIKSVYSGEALPGHVPHPGPLYSQLTGRQISRQLTHQASRASQAGRWSIADLR